MPPCHSTRTAFSALMHFTSESNEGTEVWTMHSSKSFAWATTCSSVMSAGGASISLELGTSAAGWASQVGNQKERISRLAW